MNKVKDKNIDTFLQKIVLHMLLFIDGLDFRSFSQGTIAFMTVCDEHKNDGHVV